MDFLQEKNIWVYAFIFFGKIVEVAVATVRIVLINRGERIKGSIIAAFEVLLWLLITGTVLTGFQDDMFKVAVFVVAFALGNYLGSWMEDKLAFGLCSIQVIVPESEMSAELTTQLRDNKFAVTAVKGTGKDGLRELLLLHIKRKRIPLATSIIKEKMDKAVIIVNDAKVIHGGFIRK